MYSFRAEVCGSSGSWGFLPPLLAVLYLVHHKVPHSIVRDPDLEKYFLSKCFQMLFECVWPVGNYDFDPAPCDRHETYTSSAVAVAIPTTRCGLGIFGWERSLQKIETQRASCRNIIVRILLEIVISCGTSRFKNVLGILTLGNCLDKHIYAK